MLAMLLAGRKPITYELKYTHTAGHYWGVFLLTFHNYKSTTNHKFLTQISLQLNKI